MLHGRCCRPPTTQLLPWLPLSPAPSRDGSEETAAAPRVRAVQEPSKGVGAGRAQVQRPTPELPPQREQGGESSSITHYKPACPVNPSPRGAGQGPVQTHCNRAGMPCSPSGSTGVLNCIPREMPPDPPPSGRVRDWSSRGRCGCCTGSKPTRTMRLWLGTSGSGTHGTHHQHHHRRGDQKVEDAQLELIFRHQL